MIIKNTSTTNAMTKYDLILLFSGSPIAKKVLNTMKHNAITTRIPGAERLYQFIDYFGTISYFRSMPSRNSFRVVILVKNMPAEVMMNGRELFGGSPPKKFSANSAPKR